MPLRLYDNDKAAVFRVMRKIVTPKEGVVFEALPGLSFRVKINGMEEMILAHLAGKMKIHNIRVLAGDRVLIELSPDGGRGRIIRRL